MTKEIHAGGDEQSPRIPLAVFDLDGTCISGQSGALLTSYLLNHGYLSLPRTAALMWWGLRYKLHLPCRQAEARELMFGALRTHSPHEISTIMSTFHDEIMLPLYRPLALEELARRKAEGCITLLVTATYDEIASVAADYVCADAFLATTMERDETGWYTGNISGPVIAGREKLDAAVRWADEHLGHNRWYLAAAYGDHHTDIPLLAAAMDPVAVCPSHTLTAEAHRRKWRCVDWATS